MSGYLPDDLERDILALWEREGTFAASLERRTHAPRYGFYDGPPYATGAPHYGHLLQTAIKDAVTRYWTMRGYLVDRRVGWDCHGLPVENMVEKELGLQSRKDIEAKGIEQFNALCRSFVLRKVDEWTALLRRMGRWTNYSQAYRTMDTDFIESAWWVFKTASDRGLVYKGMRPSPYCPRCETPLSHHEVTLGYKDVTDPAITVKLQLVGEENVFLLIWTTTPWTLTANAAVAVHPDLRYVRARVGPETWIVSKDRAAEVIQRDYTVEEEFAGRTLVDKTYKPIYQFDEPHPRPGADDLPEPVEALQKPAAFRVVAAPFVSGTEGTGLVHVAPAYGEEDFRLAEDEWLALFQTVDAQGRFLPKVTPWAGKFVKDADTEIINDLDARKVLLRSDTLQHLYPHCWRCETRLLYMATTSWFIAVTKIKEQLMKNAQQIHWVPAHLKDGRFGQGLKDAPDWAVSRTRYWGIPLPAWQCSACGEYTVVGSVQELEQLGGDLAVLKSPHANPDLHRPYVDRVVLKCAHCDGEARRVPEVLDVWFDSGSMPYGQWHYPFENKELVESAFPADFIGEALDQTRGWFYTLHALAGILTLPSEKDLGLGLGEPAYKNVIASGLVLAEDGRKLSKRFGNYPEPDGIVSKYGADTLRLYLLYSAKTGEDYRFSDQLVGEFYRRFTLILWNVWQYYRTYADHGPWGMGQSGRTSDYAKIPNLQSTSLLDRWILARTAKLAEDVRSAMDAYCLDDATRALLPFMDDLSTWYVRRSRGRAEALPVLREVLRVFSLVASPFTPFLAEHIHRELTGQSPHLADWLESRNVDGTVLEQMSVIRDIVHSGHLARAVAKIRIRQPLAEIVLEGTFGPLESAGEEGQQLLRDELNVKKITPVGPGVPFQRPAHCTTVGAWGGQLHLHLNTQLTEELRQEGVVRDLIRHVQDLRKQAKYRFDDTVVLSVVTDDPAVRAAVERFAGLLKEETKARELSFEKGVTDAEAGVIVDQSKVWLGTRR